MSSLFFHKVDRLPAEKKEIIIEERRKQGVEREIRVIKREIESFKARGLSFIVDDFHRPDGKIVERTVPTNLETYTDKISEDEYETGIVEDLDYIDKFKIKFLFPVLARRKFDGIKPVEIDEIGNWENPTIMPDYKKEPDYSEIEDELRLLLESETETSKIIHLADITTNFSEIHEKLSEIRSGIIMPDFFHSSKGEELDSEIMEKLMTIDNLTFENQKTNMTINSNEDELQELMKNFE